MYVCGFGATYIRDFTVIHFIEGITGRVFFSTKNNMDSASTAAGSKNIQRVTVLAFPFQVIT